MSCLERFWCTTTLRNKKDIDFSDNNRITVYVAYVTYVTYVTYAAVVAYIKQLLFFADVKQEDRARYPAIVLFIDFLQQATRRNKKNIDFRQR